uniref:Fucosyltransferase n=1 Tax=Acrobeloides nanus TaxID=290746 RepID=A0A914C962_9BILA
MRRYRIKPKYNCLIFRPSKWSIFSGLVIIIVVYVFLLRNPTDSAVEKVWVPPDLNKPIILEWAKEPPEHLITFLNAYPSNSATKCPYECYFTTDRRLLNSAKMVVFHPVNLGLNDLPPHRCNNQHYVFFTRESPPNIKNSDFEKLSSDYFNVSMTYRLDSDIFAGYDRFEKIDNGTLQYETWMDMEVIEKVSKKKRLILQFVSNCDTPSNREAYIEVLKKYINITQFGTCYEGFIHKIFNVHDCTGSCEDEEIDQHYFYLAFENSVSVDDFESPMKLAAYLHYLMTHQDEYMKYFQWTKFYKKTKAYSNARCELCTIATNQNKKTINDIRQWWINDSHCISNYGKVLLKGHKT